MQENNNATRTKRHKITAIVLISIVTLVVLIIAGAFAYTYFKSESNTISSNIYAGNTYIGNLTKEEAKKAIESNIKPQYSFTFKYNDFDIEIPGNQISFTIDAEKTARNAFNYGKKGNIVKRAKHILPLLFKEKKLDLCISYDADQLHSTLSSYLGDDLKDMVPYTVTEGENCLIINNGEQGKGLNIKDINNQLVEDMNDYCADSPVIITTYDVFPEKIDPDKFYREYNRDVKDATYTEKDGTFEFVKEVNGIKLNPDTVKKIISSNLNNKENYEIPAEITKAKVTVEQLEKKFLSRVISTYSTSFASSDANRAHNVILAASKINGVILNPGEKFSYNNVVGPRTASTGFKNAHVYEGNRIVDGMGGGICQVSSTLYNTVLMADLEIVKRTNHSMPVGYVPLGRDATVAYGLIDFIFKNNKTYPVKLSASWENRLLTISCEAVSDMDYTVELQTATGSTIPFTTRRVETTSLEAGMERVTQNGSNGAVVYTYQVYKKDGVQINRKQVAKSVYNPIEKIVEVGVIKEEENIPAISPLPPVEESTGIPPDETENSASEGDESTEENAPVPEADKPEEQVTETPFEVVTPKEEQDVENDNLFSGDYPDGL